MSKTLHLTIQEDEPLPTAGETHLFRGLAGLYAVTIHRVRRVEPLADHSQRVTVTATRRLIQQPDPLLLITGAEERRPREPLLHLASEQPGRMLTATITITAPDRSSLVECLDLVTQQVAAGTNGYEDAASGELDTRIRYHITDGDPSEATPTLLLFTERDGPLHAFTVTRTTHQYEQWHHILAPSKAALRKRIDDLGLDILGHSHKQDTTWVALDIDREKGE